MRTQQSNVIRRAQWHETSARSATRYLILLWLWLLGQEQRRTSHSPVAAAGRSRAAVSHAVAVSRRNSLRSSSRVNAAALLRPPPPCKWVRALFLSHVASR